MKRIDIEEGQCNKEKVKYWPQICFSFVICYINVSCGNILGYTSCAIPSMRDGYNNLNTNNFENLSSSNNETLSTHAVLSDFKNLTSAQVSWIGGLAPLSAFVGSIISTFLLKLLGPKGIILFIGAPLSFLSWMIIAFSHTVWVVYIGRALGGLGMGISAAVSPMYVVDSVSVNIRGCIGTIPQCLITVGILISFVIGGYLDWKQSAMACGFILAPIFIMLPFIPESPRWLISKNRYDEAQKSCRRLYGNNSTAHNEYEAIRNQNRSLHLDQNQNDEVAKVPDIENSTSPSVRSIKSRFNSTALKISAVAIGLQALQQFTGINGVNFYALSIFQATSSSSEASINWHTSSIIVASVQCIATGISFALIEKLGRKTLLVVSLTLMSLSATALGIFFYLLETQEPENSKDQVSMLQIIFQYIPLASLITFVFSFGIGLGPVTWLICAEILPGEIRAIVNPIGVGINWLSAFVVTKTYPSFVNLLDIFGTFWLYAVLGFLGLIFILMCIPETKNLSEDEIHDYFGKKVHLTKRGDKEKESFLKRKNYFLKIKS